LSAFFGAQTRGRTHSAIYAKLQLSMLSLDRISLTKAV